MKQLSIFDLIPDEDNKAADICESCRYNENGCCSYDEPLGRYCVEGDAYELKVPETAPQFPESDFAEIVDYINNKLGLNFQMRDGFKNPSYEAKYKKARLFLSKGKFSPGVNGGAYYIGVSFETPTAGRSSPVDTIEQAIDFFNSNIEDNFSPFSKHN